MQFIIFLNYFEQPNSKIFMKKGALGRGKFFIFMIRYPKFLAQVAVSGSC